MTTGPAIGVDEISAPPNVIVVASAPHSQVLPHAAAVITHGGHGTVLKTLAAGVPLVVMPLGRDQPDNAARVAHHGAGLRVRRSAKPGTIAAATRRVLDEPRFAAAARRLAGHIADDLASDRAAQELELLAGVARHDSGGDSTTCEAPAAR